LFEAGWAADWDVIICLTSGEAAQIKRLMCGRGLSEKQARLRIAAQMPLAEKAARSHIVVNNDANAEALAQEANRVFCLLRERSE
jgi:dephospho-CoA kinase